MPENIAICGDCMEVMRNFEAGFFDLAVVDPPYFGGPERRTYYRQAFSGKEKNMGKTAHNSREDKKLVCKLFFQACRATRYLGDLEELEYDAENEAVTAVFGSEFRKRIDVAGDSGFAMMKDILSSL